MGSTTVRITRNTWKSLRETARLEETNNAFLALKAKPEHWKEEQEERRLWEKTIGDNLEDEQLLLPSWP